MNTQNDDIMYDNPVLDDSDEWFEAQGAYKVGLKVARQWQAEARTALVDVGEYPPAHQNEVGEWEIQYWSPTARKGLVVFLDKQLTPLRQQEWGAFYEEKARQLGVTFLEPQGFSYVRELGSPGPDGLSFIFRRQSPTYPNQHEFVDLQISTSVMLTPPPRRFTVNLIRNNGERPLFGQFGGFETRLSAVLPNSKADYWWSFKSEEEYEARLREAFEGVLEYGLAAMM